MNTVHDTPGFSTKERMKNPGLFNSMPSMASSSDRIKAGSPTEKSRNQLLKE